MTSRTYEYEGHCPHCDKQTKQKVSPTDKEQNSFYDYGECMECGYWWVGDGMDDEDWNPPIGSNYLGEEMSPNG